MAEIHEILNLMKRMGENIYPSTLFESRIAVNPLFIEEGLIKSYPIEQVAKSIADVFHLSFNREYRKPLNSKTEEPNGTIKIISINDSDKCLSVFLPKESAIKNKLEARFLKYGWFKSQDAIDGEVNKLLFERRFGDRFEVRQLKHLTDKIYHITSSKLVKKIKKEGLVPKETKIPFTNEPRIFFRPVIPTIEDVSNMAAMKMASEPMIVIEVDLNKLNDSFAFFSDSRWGDSIYTFEPISPDAIRIINEDELPKIKLK